MNHNNLKPHHPNQNLALAPRMRCMMKNKGGLSPHHFAPPCYKETRVKIDVQRVQQEKIYFLFFSHPLPIQMLYVQSHFPLLYKSVDS